jgi:hypothetical protein
MGTETYYGLRAGAYTMEPAKKSVRINLRCPPDTLDLIDAAAEALGITRTALLLRASKQEAYSVLKPTDALLPSGKKSSNAEAPGANLTGREETAKSEKEDGNG